MVLFVHAEIGFQQNIFIYASLSGLDFDGLRLILIVNGFYAEHIVMVMVWKTFFAFGPVMRLGCDLRFFSLLPIIVNSMKIKSFIRAHCRHISSATR
jgi:hypothetical protein